MTYAIDILRSAQKQIAGIDRQDHPRILSAIRQLADNPRPPGATKLSGRPAWRIRVGPYRIIYEIHDDSLLVLVLTIGHRGAVYR